MKLFQSTSLLISEIDEFFDQVAESAMILERQVLHYLEHGADEELDEKIEVILKVEERADQLRRDIGNVMYTRMLMPDARGDVLSLLDAVDESLDGCTHILVRLAIKRPELQAGFREGFLGLIGEATKATHLMIQAARVYFRNPVAIRDYLHKINFHKREATTMAIRLGRQIIDSDLPMAAKQQSLDWVIAFRALASTADDVGDRLAIFSVKRSI